MGNSNKGTTMSVTPRPIRKSFDEAVKLSEDEVKQLEQSCKGIINLKIHIGIS